MTVMYPVPRELVRSEVPKIYMQDLIFFPG